MNSSKVREKFLEYFRAKDHEIVPSAPLVVKDDPTLMFTNAGMNQFKDWFLGNSTPKYKRVADTQKCLRVSGKHNDLEEVGVDTYHHTMFEMLGNWSFGDYFKKEAIQWSWELLTGVYRIPQDKLYVTVFEGSPDDKLAFDQEAYDEWKKYIPESRILRGNRKDNFWEMGETGPCGPCSEIHVDMRDETERVNSDGKVLVNTGHPQVIEIWNNVFMEFNRKSDGSLEKLPAQHVDTGMGFERLCMVLQGKKSTYDTDVFQPIIHKIEDLSGLRYKPEDSKNRSAEVVNIGMRVIADHVRAISFAIADGQLPSNTGAGYVIRRILRRAVRYGYQSLNLKEPFIHRLVPILSNQMGQAFPELVSQKILIERVIKEEETSFFKTLEFGLKKIDQVCISIVNDTSKKKIVDGKVVFELYDTFGFPIDLTALIARGYGLEIDMKGFQEELDKQVNRSREATAVEAGDWEIVNEGNKYEFVGYNTLNTSCKILRYRKVTAKNKTLYQVVLDKTPFYAEGGGQVGDTGFLINGYDKTIVLDTKRENNLIIHFINKLPRDIQGPFTAEVDREKRISTENNHSATHLLHAALRTVLGTHVEQKGSLVNGEHLRFDFSHFSKVGEEELKNIETMVNKKIREGIEVEIKNLPIAEAKKMGAMALFGEKYGDIVRVVTIDKDYSIELCGGTHVKNTSQIGLFHIVSEAAVASGIRRIEAITSLKAEEFLKSKLELIHDIKEALGNPPDILKAITELKSQNHELKKSLESFTLEKAKNEKARLLKSVEKLNGISAIISKIDLESADAIKNVAFELKAQIDDLFLVLGAVINGKPSLTVVVAEKLIKEKNLNAGTIIRELAKEIHGGGGGQPFYATAGGTDVNGIEKALEKARTLLIPEQF
jgi:alanyl-tRNA synthetase